MATLVFVLCKDLDIFIREPNIAPTLAILRGLGYQRDTQLTAAQLNLLHSDRPSQSDVIGCA